MDNNFIKRIGEFDNLVKERIDLFKIPGTEILIIKDGEVILSKGYGLRDIDKNLPVSKETLFGIGSTSKAFTSMAIGILVDEGKLEWDTPIRKYIPWFKMYDAAATEKITVRDLLCHRTGLPSHDLMWYNSSFSRKEIVERVQYLEPSVDFRSSWQYQNHMFVVAGYLVEAVTGKTWEEFVYEKIFEPLGMNSSNFSVDDSQKTKDFSKPYDIKADKTIEIPFRNIDNAGPAGSINSNVVDLAKWILLNLNKGKFGDKQIISEANINQIHTPHMPCPRPAASQEIQLKSYGLGWIIESFRGRKLVFHTGGIDGFTCLGSFMPNENLGAFILTNLNAVSSLNAISFLFSMTYGIYDMLLGYEGKDWSKILIEQSISAQKESNKLKESFYKEKKQNTKPSHSLEEYCGKYENPGYGVVTISLENQKLKLNHNSFDMILDHYHYDIFSFYHNAFGFNFSASFITDTKGNINSISIPFEMDPRIKEIVFTKI